LMIRQAGEAVLISWSPALPGFVLEMKDDLQSKAWITAPTGNPVTIPLTLTARFFRLRH
jgi:hypothetical protein